MGRKPTKPSSPFDVLKDVTLAPPKAASKSAGNASPAKSGARGGSGAASTVRAVGRDGAKSAESAKSADAAPVRDYAERIAMRNAYAGVRRLGGDDGPKVVQPPPKSAEEVAAQAQRDAEARARLDAFVGQAQRFVVERDGDHVRGRRDDLSPAQASQLFARAAAPEQKLDLHGLRAEDAARQVVTFTRSAQRAGKRVVIIVHGRGQHSAGGVGVLAEVVLETLSRGGAAPVVRAFASAPQRQGGAGALLVFLSER
ncbi:MAG: Smr/MutS family protein [Sandaracinaceae bacterium]|nr:Smr/MutS family protein [Sandaracinaceae bacterium]